MCSKTLRIVTSVNSWLQAAARVSALERAGIPVTVIKPTHGSYLDLAVPEEFVYDALNLLSPAFESPISPVAALPQML